MMLQKEKIMEHSYIPSRRQPILYIMGILITKANRSSMNVFSALQVSILHGRCATDFILQLMKSCGVIVMKPVLNNTQLTQTKNPLQRTAPNTLVQFKTVFCFEESQQKAKSHVYLRQGHQYYCVQWNQDCTSNHILS